MNKILWTWIMFTAGISYFSLHFQPFGRFLHFLPLGWLLQSIILFSRQPVLPKDSKMCLLHHKDSPLIVCTTVPKIIFYLLLLQRFLSVRGIPTLLDINLHLLRNMIITLNHLSSVCYVLLISKDCSSCSMCRRRQCLLVNSRNLPTVKGTRWCEETHLKQVLWCWNLWCFVELAHKCWEEETIFLKRGRLIWNFLSACQEVIEPNFSLLCHLYWV